jgi:hypothetical protein
MEKACIFLPSSFSICYNALRYGRLKIGSCGQAIPERKHLSFHLTSLCFLTALLVKGDEKKVKHEEV